MIHFLSKANSSIIDMLGTLEQNVDVPHSFHGPDVGNPHWANATSFMGLTWNHHDGTILGPNVIKCRLHVMSMLAKYTMYNFIQPFILIYINNYQIL